MKKVKQILTIVMIGLGGVVLTQGAHAELQFSQDVDVKFTFNPTLSVNLSSSKISIVDLAPGQVANSNEITVTVDTNSAYGYELMATVGSSAKDYTDLKHSNGVNLFSSVATDASLADLSTPNTWGYAVSTNGGTTWSNYSGLPKYDEWDKELNSSTTSGGSATEFRIRANAASGQASGEYTNVINFVATANPATAITMQEMTLSQCTATVPVEVVDARDNQVYTVQKLEDNNCWMMENLNLGDTDNYPLAVANLDSSNTNLASGVSDIPAATFTSWKKTSGTGTRTSAEFITVSGTDSVSGDPYNTLYNYCATSAGTMCNDQYLTATNAESSLCPAGWRLPTGGSNSEFTALMTAYGGLASNMTNSTNPTGATMQNILRTQLKMTFAGSFYSSTPASQGSYGVYWSSTWSGSTNMCTLSLNATDVVPTGNNGRYYGGSIRCVLR